jgi:hypothetical protein
VKFHHVVPQLDGSSANSFRVLVFSLSRVGIAEPEENIRVRRLQLKSPAEGSHRAFILTHVREEPAKGGVGGYRIGIQTDRRAAAFHGKMRPAGIAIVGILFEISLT